MINVAVLKDTVVLMINSVLPVRDVNLNMVFVNVEVNSIMEHVPEVIVVVIKDIAEPPLNFVPPVIAKSNMDSVLKIITLVKMLKPNLFQKTVKL